MKFPKITSILVLLVAVLCVNSAFAQPRVYINPGHGGHTSNDRNVVVPGYAQGDTAGYWESNSNLKKGFALMELLKKNGYKTNISRIHNTEDDDLALSTIVALSNNSGADVFFSIHSNATGAGDNYRINFPLGLYRGYSGEPQIPKSDELTKILMEFLYANKSTVWTSNYAIYGDWTFYDWGTQGLGALRGQKAVSMLSEGSFHDYIPEALRLLSNNFCWVEGYNFYLATNKFFNIENSLNYGLVTGRILDDRILRTGSFVMHDVDVREPVCGATVRLLNADGVEVDRCVTDNDRNGIYLFKYVTPGTYTVEVSDDEHFTTQKTVEVPFNTPTYLNFDLKRVRNTPPEVVSYSPVWNTGDEPVLCNTPIVLNFNWDMDVPSTQAAFSITPAVEGEFSWEDTNYRMIFTPTDAYDINTEYTVTLKASAQHGGGTAMGNDFSFKFVTTGRNHLTPLAIFPGEGDPVHYQSVNVEMRTDSLLRSLNLYTLFHVLDKDGNEVGVNKRSLKNNKKGDPYGFIRIPLSGTLNVGETYTLNIERDVCDTVGIHLATPLSFSFTAVDAGAAKDGTQLVAALEAVNEVEASGFATATTASTTKLFGSKSIQVKYDFNNADNDHPTFDLTLNNVPELQFAKGDTIGAHISGDLSCNRLYAKFNMTLNTGGQSIPMGSMMCDMGKIDFNGWRYVTAPIELAVEGCSLQFAGFQVMGDKGNLIGQTGTILFDDVLKKEGSPSAVQNLTLDGVTVGPNPSSDYIVAAADTYIQGVELYDLQGKLVARNAANFVNVSEVASGVYVMKVYVNGLTSTHKVIVKH